MTSATDFKLFGETAEFNGFFDMLARISPQEWLISAGFIVLACGLAWWVRRWLGQHRIEKTTPPWFSSFEFSRFVLPFFLWLSADLVQVWAEFNQQPANWYEFLSQIFGTFFVVRLFLYMVRRALPKEGGIRHSIERLAIVSIWMVMLLNYVGKLDAWVQQLDDWHVKLGKNTITATNVLTLLLVVGVAWLVVKWLDREIEYVVLKNPNRYFAEINLSVRVVVVHILKAILLVVAVLLSLTAAGLDLTVLSVFGGALGVGIGLGLQKIASNYVSGFVILFEGSVRIGDLISTVDGSRGYVTQINSRYAVIQGTDGSETLVPNESLVTSPVVNWSLHEKNLWMSTSVQVKHETDIDFIRPKLLEVVSAIPRVLPNPAACVYLSKITEKGYVLEVAWWINDPENGRSNINSDVNMAIWQTCRAFNVEFFSLQASEPEKATT